MNSLPKKSARLFKDWGRQGGESRARRLSASRRSQIAKKAAEARWAETKKRDMPSVRLDNPQLDNPVYVEEILSGGTIGDWRELYRKVSNYPYGLEAAALQRVLSSTKIYGITPLWRGLLKRLQE